MIDTLKESDSRSILVSIRCCTYNHEPYIRQCLEGFVMQKTNFRFEAIVHDDASTDGTANIIREYAEKYPDIIKPIFETENQYSKRDGSLRRIMNAHMFGKYVAMCEGDDYWIDPLKLQKQVDFLENNPDYGLVCTDVDFYYQLKERFIKKYFTTKKYPIRYTFEDFLERAWFIATCTWMYRRSLLTLNQDKPHFIVGDLPLLLEISSQSKVKYLNDVTSVYRVLQHSASHLDDYGSAIRYHKGILSIQLFYANKCDRVTIVPFITKRWLYLAIKIAVKHVRVTHAIFFSYSLLCCHISSNYYRRIISSLDL
jgi:glycosyltransferase involved in cell wall biosynthesis